MSSHVDPSAASNCHWITGAGVPVAPTVKLAVSSGSVDMLAGCRVIVGATADCATVSRPGPLVAHCSTSPGGV